MNTDSGKNFYRPTNVQRLVDNFVGLFAPGRQLERMKQRAQVARFASGVDYGSRLRNAVPMLLSPNTAKAQMDRIELMKEGRYLGEFFWPIRNLVVTFGTYTAGTIDYEPDTGDPKIDAEYDDYLTAKFSACDATERQNFQQIAQQAIMEAICDGDFFDIYIDSPTGIRTLAIEADRVGSPWANQVMDGYAGGIFFNNLGAPRGWRIYQRTPWGAYTNPQDVFGSLGYPVTHFFKTLRHDSYRGNSHLEAVAKVARDLDVTFEAEGLAVQFASKRAGAIEIDPALDDGDEPEADDTVESSQNRQEQVWAPGTFTRLRKGEKFHEIEVNRPTDGWLGLIKLMSGAFANTFGLPAGWCFEISMGAGPETRLRSKRAERVFMDWQSHLLKKRLEPHKNMFIMDGIARGFIRPCLRPFDGTWSFGSHPSIDAGRESAADLNENARGATPLSVIVGRDGRRVRQTIRQCAKEAAMKREAAKEFDVTVPEFSLMTPNGTPAQPQTAKPQLPPKPAPPNAGQP